MSPVQWEALVFAWLGTLLLVWWLGASHGAEWRGRTDYDRGFYAGRASIRRGLPYRSTLEDVPRFTPSHRCQEPTP